TGADFYTSVTKKPENTGAVNGINAFGHYNFFLFDKAKNLRFFALENFFSLDKSLLMGDPFVSDFQGIKEGLEKLVDSAVKWAITLERETVLKEQAIPFETLQNQDAECIKGEVVKMFSGFIGSEAYKELQAAQILGREVPILLNWDGQIMRGMMDILYKIGDHLIIADYKTDHITMNDLPSRAEKYCYQKKGLC
ncbi:MAG: hypothetical protein AYP45_10790, partial [Candidatus Brocadia carolinensis]